MIERAQSNLFFILFFFFIGFRLWVITHLGLIDDEAYHWSWAKWPEISYFDHPGMVAWLIWPFIKIFGDHEWVIRLPGFIVYLGILGTLYGLAKDLFSKQVAKLCVLLLFLVPLWGFASLATMPDMPLGFFWILAAWIFWQGVREDEKTWSPAKTWLLLGLTLGLGMNSKLTCCLIGLGMGLYLLLSAKNRSQLLSPWPYFGALVTFAMMTPIFVWNSGHEWATFDYQFLSRHQEAHFLDLNRWLQFWSLQWLFMSPGVYVMMLISLAYGLLHLKDPRWRFIVCLPLPALMLFYYQPLMSAYKPHWSGPAYMILYIGAVALFTQGVGRWLKPLSKPMALFSLAFLLPLQLIYIPLFKPVLPALAESVTGKSLFPSEDFTNDFYGWQELGAHLRELQDDIELKTGQRPPIAGQRYEIVAQLTWAIKDRAWQLCKDRDQYFYWQRDELASLQGKNFLVVNTDKYPRDPTDAAIFQKCASSQWPFYRDAVLARVFNVYYCENFQGLK
jgi:dolichol-phosphate mannosyltransferase